MRDDLGAALPNISLLATLLPMFKLAKSVAGLAVKPEKCIVVRLHVPYSLHVSSVIGDWLAEHVYDWRKFKIDRCAKYLGLWLGPGAGTREWVEQSDQRFCRTCSIAKLGASPRIAVMQYYR